MKVPRTRERQDRVRQIQAAARAVFFEHGFRNSSMEAVARKAGVSKGTIYLYFANKEELYVSLMMPVLEELGRRLSALEQRVAAHEYGDHRAFFRDFFLVHLETYRYDPDGIRIVQAFLQGDHFAAMGEETLERINTRARTNYRVYRRIIATAIERRILAQADPLKLADVLWALFIGVVQVEESRLRATGKDHLPGTLEYAFSILSREQTAGTNHG